MINEFDKILELLEQFRDERDWAQFHDSKNLALALSIEVAGYNFANKYSKSLTKGRYRL